MKTKDQFKEYVAQILEKSGGPKPCAFGIGVRRFHNNKTLDVTYPLINFKENNGTAAVFSDVFGIELAKKENQTVKITRDDLAKAYAKFEAFHGELEDHANVALLKQLLDAPVKEPYYGQREMLVYFMFEEDKPVEDAIEGYFKLQCLSQRKALPHSLCLDGLFGKLENIAWSDKGPILAQDLLEEQNKALLSEPLVISHVDKFPYMVNYHVPEGVRIAAGAKARLGAHLGKGTTVMQAGFVNFNAGTKGTAMVEGRISAGVLVGEDSDIGGGASIMGTLSGGNKKVIKIGKQCLLGANAGTGISLGDGCTIAAGTYVTAGAKISLYDKDGAPINEKGEKVLEGENIVKGEFLSEKAGYLYLQDSQTGKIVARPNPKKIELNEALHKN